MDGKEVVLRGFGITDTEYLLRSIGMTSWYGARARVRGTVPSRAVRVGVGVRVHEPL